VIVNQANRAAEEERMPWKEGWRPTNRIDSLSTAKNVLQLALLTPEKSPELRDMNGH
jgi:hypothetical protein